MEYFTSFRRRRRRPILIDQYNPIPCEHYVCVT